MNRRTRAIIGLYPPEVNEPVKQHASDPRPMAGARMGKDGYEVLGRRSTDDLPGEIEENYPSRNPMFGMFGPADDDFDD